jgi:hypothetical protein
MTIEAQIEQLNGNIITLIAKLDKAALAAASAPAGEPVTAKPPKATKPPKDTGETAPSAKTVADAIMKLANTVSRASAVAVLAQFKAAKVPELDPKNYAAVLRVANAALAEAEAAKGSTGPEPSSDSLI